MDAEYSLSYLISKYLNGYNDAIELFEECGSENINRINIYPIELQEQVLYYILEKIDSKYSFHEISESDTKNYIKTLDGVNKWRIL